MDKKVVQFRKPANIGKKELRQSIVHQMSDVTIILELENHRTMTDDEVNGHIIDTLYFHLLGQLELLDIVHEKEGGTLHITTPANISMRANLLDTFAFVSLSFENISERNPFRLRIDYKVAGNHIIGNNIKVWFSMIKLNLE